MSTDTIYDELLSEEVHKAQTWKADKFGDLIVGRCLVCSEKETRYGPRLLIKADCHKVKINGEIREPGVYGIWASAAIREICEEKRLRSGDKFAFQYLKDAPAGSSGGNPKKLFRSVVKRTAESGEFSLKLTPLAPRQEAPLSASQGVDLTKQPVAATTGELPKAEEFDDDIPF